MSSQIDGATFNRHRPPQSEKEEGRNGKNVEDNDLFEPE